MIGQCHPVITSRSVKRRHRRCCTATGAWIRGCSSWTASYRTFWPSEDRGMRRCFARARRTRTAAAGNRGEEREEREEEQRSARHVSKLSWACLVAASTCSPGWADPLRSSRGRTQGGGSRNDLTPLLRRRKTRLVKPADSALGQPARLWVLHGTHSVCVHDLVQTVPCSVLRTVTRRTVGPVSSFP